MTGRLIVIDGIDGVGKTTTAKLLANKLNGIYFPTPNEQVKGIRDYFGQGNKTAKYLFYLGALINSSEEIFQLLYANNVVVDRYLASTICYHRVLGVAVDRIDWNSLPIVKPDFEFCLTVAERQVWLKRISSRENVGTKTAISHDFKKFMLIADEISSFTLKRGGTTIDTGELRPEQVLEKMLEVMNLNDSINSPLG